MPTEAKIVRFIKYRSQNPIMVEEARIISEVSVSLTVNGSLWLSWMCTPSDLEDLAVGFLFNEGVIERIDEVEIVRLCNHGQNVDVWLSHPAEKPITWHKTSGCSGGMTGEDTYKHTHVVSDSKPIQAEEIFDWMNQLLESQSLYRETRGVHCSLLTDGEKIIASAEDIGRHNTLDKIAGKLLRQSLQPHRRILLTTGRISSEMLQKSARIKASVLISRTSPTSLSIQLAERLGITVVGYARPNQFNVYTHPQRIKFGQAIPIGETLSGNYSSST